jgi:hypothetical protein
VRFEGSTCQMRGRFTPKPTPSVEGHEFWNKTQELPWDLAHCVSVLVVFVHFAKLNQQSTLCNTPTPTPPSTRARAFVIMKLMTRRTANNTHDYWYVCSSIIPFLLHYRFVIAWFARPLTGTPLFAGVRALQRCRSQRGLRSMELMAWCIR